MRATPGNEKARAIQLKLNLFQAQGVNQINSCARDCVIVNGTRHHTSIIVTPDTVVPNWPAACFAALDVEHLADLLKHQPEVVLIGTGATLRFPQSALLRPLIEANVGYEIMDTAAACRTYNVLVAEARRVVAGLIVP